jgi:hypothetical protein
MGPRFISDLRSPRIVGEAGFTLHEIRFTKYQRQRTAPHIEVAETFFMSNAC